MKYSINILFLLASFALHAQDSIRYRVIIIGDAGEMSAAQQNVIMHAAGQVLPGITSSVFLGDNIYPHGMGLPGSKEENRTREILLSQYQFLRAKGSPVYFLPGNHDWDKMGPDGLAKIRRQSDFLESQNDSLLRMIPAKGCPDPVAVSLNDSLTLIAMDTEWWLFPFPKEDELSECECKTPDDVIARLNELRYENRNKMVLLASHHPFSSYGVHGGKYSLKDHLFPLTAANKHLYIPLPGIGSLYPLLRSVFANAEDLGHPLYKNMTARITSAFDSFPNIAYLAGHEHGLQFIRNERIQIVSGAGAKYSSIKKGRNSLFADSKRGYVVADLLPGATLRFTYYLLDGDELRKVFEYPLNYTPPLAESAGVTNVLTEDSITVQVHPSYDRPGRGHRRFFGENYRKEWASATRLPVIRISEFHGGLTPVQLGGGMQSKSLRLKDGDNREWVIRSVEKNPEKLLPAALQGTFAKTVLDDVTSAQHPFSALVVPPIANAVGVPHSNPVIGVISSDKNLGMYNRTFSNLVALVEEREPLGESDNSAKMKKNLLKDNDNRIDAHEMLQARMLDVIVGDWDRHEDQWRWFDSDPSKSKTYVAVPRDRDQVFHVTQGLIPWIAAREYILPTLRDFSKEISRPEWLIFKTRFVNAYPEMQLSRETWREQARKFQAAATDSVFNEALRRLPSPAYELRHDKLFKILVARREKLPEAMDAYYRFIQKVADIRLSDKNEFVEINGASDGGLQVKVSKISKKGEISETLMNKTFERGLTKEVRIYLSGGHDSTIVKNDSSSIRLRIIGGEDQKSYAVLSSKKKTKIYDRENGSTFTGDASRFKKYLAADTSITSFIPVNLYNSTMPLLTMGLNVDDGFILGGGFDHIRQEGFRKTPYSSRQTLMAAHSFSTNAYRFKYTGEWMHAIGKADLVMQAVIKAPDNTINFFGRGNETGYAKTGDFKAYYRARFSYYQFDPVIRWRGTKGSSVSIGPSLYYYRFDQDDNVNRFISNASAVGSYDSLTVDKEKWHLGMAVNFINDTRNNRILPQWGSYINIRLQAYKGVGEYARSYMQLIPQIAGYKSINARSTVVLADRIGGTVSIGKTAFYQSAFIGGHENLLGYRQYRFAGQHSVYNNLELRIKLTDLANYIIAGQLGITGFWDVGRVWEKHDNSGKWHNGTGGGIYFAPASMLVLNFVVANSTEGWYPYFTLGLRF